jgi:hypothetical protein
MMTEVFKEIMNMKKRMNITGGAVLLSCALLLAGCGPQGRTDGMEAPKNVPPEHAVSEYDVERAEVESDLLALRDRIDTRIDDVDHRLAREDVNEAQRRELMRYREDLQDRRNQVERARRDVDASRTDNWNTVRRAVNNTADDIGNWFDRQGDRLESIFRDDFDAGRWDD